MLTQPINVKIDEENHSPSRSSLANIGMNENERKYDAVFADDRKDTTDEDNRTQNVDADKQPVPKDDILLDGDATPKVSRVSKRFFLA